MNIKFVATMAAPTVALAALTVGSGIAPVSAQPYGPDTCISGYVWREARTGDTVCVTPDIRETVAQQNATPGANKDPNAGSGPQSCSQGYVWREAFDGVTICVTSAFRQQMYDANAAASSRKVANQPQPTPTAPTSATVVFEVTGSGTVYDIVTDPPGPQVADHTPLPWKRTMTVDPGVNILQVVATGRDTPGPGCRITLGGKVVVEEPIGGSAHCIWSR